MTRLEKRGRLLSKEKARRTRVHRALCSGVGASELDVTARGEWRFLLDTL